MALFTGHTITPDSALGGIQLERSLRFDDNQSSPTRLTRTIQSGGNRKKFTLSVWVKRSQLGTTSYSNSAGNGGQSILHTVGEGNRGWIRFNSDDTLGFDQGSPAGVGGGIIDTVAVYRDVTSWYHLVFVADYANSTAADRAKIYVNGVQQEVSTTRSFLQDTDGEINANDIHEIGFSEYGQGYTGSSWWFEFFCGYMAEYHFVDGQSYDPTYFGFTDAQTGQWRPKKYQGTHGTTGWYLPFTDNSSTSALGKDHSGNANDWTANGFSVSAGSDNDSMLDIPTNNFSTLAGGIDDSGNVPEDGNLQGGTAGTSGWRHTRSTVPLPSSGKWYWEYKVPDASANASNGWMTGIAYSNLGYTQDINSNSTGLYGRQTDSKYNNSSGSPVTNSHFTSPSNNDILQYAYDADSQTLFTGRNNTWELSANPSTGANPNWTGVASGGYPMVGSYGSSRYVIINFGQQGFSYTPPTGYRALNSRNLATPVTAEMIRPQRHFETLIYDGDGSASRDITGLEFRPDVVWIKNRSQASTHSWQDSIIGFGDDKTLRVDTSNALDTNGNLYGYVNYTLPNGFNVNAGSDHGSSRVNSSSSGAKHVAWCWKAGGAAVSNSDGSITSSVSVNTEAGFSIMSYTGNGTDGATVGHGLGATPQWVMIKNKSTSSRDWIIHHPNLDSGKTIFLNSNGTQLVNGGGTATNFNNSTIRLDSGSGGLLGINHNGDDYAAYCWVEIPGYSKFGGYTGNGSTDGTFVHLGFKPAWLMIRVLSNGFDWVLQDNKRSPTNLCDNKLNPNQNAVEQTDYDKLDMLSNGFKPRVSDAGVNANGSSYIYFAFAERPTGTFFGLDANAR